MQTHAPVSPRAERPGAGRLRRPAAAVVVGLMLAVFGATAASAAPTTLYVDQGNTSCSDSGPGSAAQPFCTIGKGASVATAGQTVLVAAGTYAGNISVAHSGAAGSPVTLAAAGGASVTVSGGTHGFTVSSKGYVTVQGFAVTATSGDGISVSSSNHITISANHVTNAGQPVSGQVSQGIQLSNTTDSLVSGNVTDHNTEAGIQLTNGSTGNTVQGNESFANARGYTRAAPGIDLRAPGNTVIGNVAHDNEDTGIQSYTGGSNGLIVNNVAYGNGDHGIDDLNVTGQRIIGNSVYGNVTAGINVEGSSSGATIENNVSVDNGIASPRTHSDIRVDANSISGSTVDYNVTFLTRPDTLYVWGSSSFTSLAAFQSATGQGAHDRQADPRWVSPGGHDFHLTAGSPAIDSADAGVSGQQASDLEGHARVDDPATANSGVGPRTFDDRGAYEFQPGGGPPPDNPPNAALGVTPNSGTAPLGVTANASGSSDTDATPIASYTFDFGDGTTVGPQVAATAAHTYSNPGSFTVTVTVADTAGKTGTASAAVTVNPAQADNPPNAALGVTPSSGTAPLGVTANASGSSDTDATPIASYTFDFGDGTTVGPQVAATAAHTYSNPGSFTVTVTVADTAGKTGTASAAVTVSSGGGGGSNLVGNPGFESDLSGWNGTGLARVAGGHSGGSAAKLENTGSSATSCTLNDSPNWVATTAAGTYTGSIWVRADSAGATVKVRFREYNGSTLVSSATTSATLGTAWQQVTVGYTPGAAGTSTLDFNAYISSAPTGVCFYADDASITLG